MSSENEEDLWPVRMVAEYAYCPRLFYLMAVEGLFVPNAETTEGLALHRRSAQPTAESETPEWPSDFPPPPGKERRSLALSSPTLKITGVLDRVHLAGKEALPIEYRRGGPHYPHSAAASPAENIPEPWPTDRVQIGLYALLLEEAGYQVSEAILYYGKEKRIMRVPVKEALKAEARQILAQAQETARGPRPAPLLDDPRCQGCSVQPLCLPDEVHLEQSRTSTPRALWPPREEGLQVVVQQRGASLHLRGQTLRVVEEETLRQEIPLATLESLTLVGAVQISTQALHALADRDIPVAFLSPAGRLIAVLDPLSPVSAVVRRAQLRLLEQPEACLQFARALISAKIANQRTLLLRNHPALPAEVASEMLRYLRLAHHAPSLEVLRGYEGYTASLYFAQFPHLFPPPLGAKFATYGRKRRPPPDPINACLSLAYSLLTQEAIAALRLASLEPSLGAFHSSRPGRPALALDLIEPFRPLIADSLALTAFNRKELSEGHFMRTSAGCAFTDAGRAAFFKAYARRMATEITHPFFGYRLSYRRMLHLHARMIAAWMVGDINSLHFLTTR